MKIGVISSTELCLPLLYECGSRQFPVSLYYAAAPGDAAAQQTYAFCQQFAVPLVRGADPEDIYRWATDFRPDIIFMVGFGQLLEADRFDFIPGGLFNIHFGSLPRYRGPSPVFWQLKNGEPALGLCIHRVVRKADAGAVVWQKEIPNEDHFSYTLVNQQFSHLLLEGVRAVLQQWQEGRDLSGHLQDEAVAKYHPRPALKDVMIDWQVMDAASIVHLCKACNDWNKGAITVYKGMEVKLIDAWMGSSTTIKQPGTILRVQDGLLLSCKEGSLEVGYLSLGGVQFGARYAAKFGFLVNERVGV